MLSPHVNVQEKPATTNYSKQGLQPVQPTWYKPAIHWVAHGNMTHDMVNTCHCWVKRTPTDAITDATE